ncbi:MAG: very short patch repair endonuclease [Pseudomonadota bacterium]|nr:very short patch repair endonuclease [Pseudomonadota bacterium]
MSVRSDVFSKEKRSEVMRAVKSANTRPEIALRKALHRRGLRYRLHAKGLPGTPDLVFPRYGAVLFVHGCFWHGHDCSRGARVPKSNSAYWTAKIARNKARDAETARALKKSGWRVITVWECEMKDVERAADRAARAIRRAG